MHLKQAQLLHDVRGMALKLAKKDKAADKEPEGEEGPKWDQIAPHIERAKGDLEKLLAAVKSKKPKDALREYYQLLVNASWVGHELGLDEAKDQVYDAARDVLSAAHRV